MDLLKDYESDDCSAASSTSPSKSPLSPSFTQNNKNTSTNNNSSVPQNQSQCSLDHEQKSSNFSAFWIGANRLRNGFDDNKNRGTIIEIIGPSQENQSVRSGTGR